MTDMTLSAVVEGSWTSCCLQGLNTTMIWVTQTAKLRMKVSTCNWNICWLMSLTKCISAWLWEVVILLIYSRVNKQKSIKLLQKLMISKKRFSISKSIAKKTMFLFFCSIAFLSEQLSDLDPVWLLWWQCYGWNNKGMICIDVFCSFRQTWCFVPEGQLSFFSHFIL